MKIRNQRDEMQDQQQNIDTLKSQIDHQNQEITQIQSNFNNLKAKSEEDELSHKRTVHEKNIEYQKQGDLLFSI